MLCISTLCVYFGANFANAKFACGGGEIRPVPQLGTGHPEPIMWFGTNLR